MRAVNKNCDKVKWRKPDWSSDIFNKVQKCMAYSQYSTCNWRSYFKLLFCSDCCRKVLLASLQRGRALQFCKGDANLQWGWRATLEGLPTGKMLKLIRTNFDRINCIHEFSRFVWNHDECLTSFALHYGEVVGRPFFSCRFLSFLDVAQMHQSIFTFDDSNDAVSPKRRSQCTQVDRLFIHKK